MSGQINLEVQQLREALELLYLEQVDYITRNHLGDPHANHSMRMARAALERRVGVFQEADWDWFMRNPDTDRTYRWNGEAMTLPIVHVRQPERAVEEAPARGSDHWAFKP